MTGGGAVTSFFVTFLFPNEACNAVLAYVELKIEALRLLGFGSVTAAVLLIIPSPILLALHVENYLKLCYY